MDGLLVKNMYDLFDCYRMQGHRFVQTGTYSRSMLIQQLLDGRELHAFSKETTQYAKLRLVFDAANRVLYMRTDLLRMHADSFFVSMDEPRLMPYPPQGTLPWAIAKNKALFIQEKSR